MPYINQSDREYLEHFIRCITGPCPARTVGELNYIITRLLVHWMKPLSYGVINSAIGVLECCKLELYRRLAVDYEISKCKENGDVFDES